jgi:UDPglucose 6-dehydrogenase
MADIAVIGAGYVGLTTGACLAHLGHTVTIADIDAEKVAQLEKGDIPIFEPGLSELLTQSIEEGKLQFVIGASKASSEALFHFLCLPTPPNPDGSTNMEYFNSAIDEIREILIPDSIIVNKSTLPVGTASKLTERISRDDVHIVSNPEFLSEGNAIQDFFHPSRIIIGANSQEAATSVATLYKGIEAPIILTDTGSAELTKHTANAFLAMKLTFVNEIATLCELVGANILDVTKGIGHDPRIGANYLQPGPGWGGSCFPKDSASLLQTAKLAGFDFELLEKAITLNQTHLKRTAQKVFDTFSTEQEFENSKIAVLGLTFKAGTDDLRSSPSLAVIEHLLARNAQITAYDPMVTLPTSEIGEIEVVGSAYEAANGADVLVVLTEWQEFADLDFNLINETMRRPVIVDARNLLDPHYLEPLGFLYIGIGQ